MAVVEHTLGTVVPNTTVQIAARVSGVIDTAAFKEGQMVKKGDLLFVIDPRPYQAAYDNAVATLKPMPRPRPTAIRNCWQQNAISPQDKDDAQAAYAVAKANAEAARLNLEFTQIRSPVDGKTGPILVQPGNMVIGQPDHDAAGDDRPDSADQGVLRPAADRPAAHPGAPEDGKGLTATVDLQDPGGTAA